ncbi:MAG: hypothetical protein PHN51_12580 [Candidatus Nanopelagicales bacterium]|nr:hypothetical protein [Candidatus Nanopelagicales bacterium]
MTVAVTVAVRLTPEVPAEKVNVARPFASVVAVAGDSKPVVLEKSTTWPERTALLEERTVAVMVAELEPSLVTLVEEVESWTEAALVLPVVVVEIALPPHPARVSVEIIKAERSFC